MKKSCLFFMLFFLSLATFAQTADYSFVSAKVESPNSVKITLKTFAEKKKSIDFEAKCAALKIAMFDGIEGTIYRKPLLAQGTIALTDNADYFNYLFNNRLSDVVRHTIRKSDYKKAEKGEKSTLFMVDLNYIQLRKDLEKNNIKKQLGL